MDHEKLAEEIHEGNVAAGWWSDITTGERKNRNVGELLCLVHSEISEAFEGWSNNLMDDKLPHRKMVEVELADTLIRLYDIAGFYTIKLNSIPYTEHTRLNSTPGFFCLLHWLTSNAMEGHRKQNLDKFFSHITELVKEIWIFGHVHKLDIAGAIEEKRQYNASRADHQIENRLAKGGKQF